MANKNSSDLSVFQAFATTITAKGLAIDLKSIAHENPPSPDISCVINGGRHYFELSQIVDERLAQDAANSSKKRIDSDGGWFSEEEPLVARLRAKAAKTYSTGGSRVDLLLYYEQQFPFAPSQFLTSCESDIFAALVPCGPFNRIWIFSTWSNEIISEIVSAQMK